VEPGGGRLRPLEDLRNRPRSGGRGKAKAAGLSLGNKKSSYRHKLLREFQPTEREAGRPSIRSIDRVTRSGIRTGSGEHELDAIVYATGFDALTGSILALNATGRSRGALADAWS